MPKTFAERHASEHAALIVSLRERIDQQSSLIRMLETNHSDLIARLRARIDQLESENSSFREHYRD